MGGKKKGGKKKKGAKEEPEPDKVHNQGAEKSA